MISNYEKINSEHMRKGQKLINYANHLTGELYDPPTETERLIFNMTDKEFEKVFSTKWDDLIKGEHAGSRRSR